MALDEQALDAFLSAPEGEPTPEVETPAAEVAAEVVAPDAPAPDLSQDTFDRKYVESLRKESAGYRERAKAAERYTSAFDGYEDGAVEEWLRLAQQLRSDPKSTAAELATLVEQINNAYAEDVEGTPTADEVHIPEGYLRQADVEKMFAEREQKADLDRRVSKIETDAIELGYKVGSQDYDELLWTASRLPDGNIQKAHEHIETRNQAIYDRMISKVAGAPNPKVPQGSTPPGQERDTKDWDSAASALEAWMQGQG